jgi:hypothetical protein
MTISFAHVYPPVPGLHNFESGRRETAWEAVAKNPGITHAEPSDWIPQVVAQRCLPNFENDTPPFRRDMT